MKTIKRKIEIDGQEIELLSNAILDYIAKTRNSIDFLPNPYKKQLKKHLSFVNDLHKKILGIRDYTDK